MKVLRGLLMAGVAVLGLSFPASASAVDNDAFFAGASEDGSRVFFESAADYDPGDLDGAVDIYMRFGGATTLISAGQINGLGNFDVTFVGATPDGTHVFFETSEQLASSDTDTSVDVYERFGGTTSHVSAGDINGNGAFDAEFQGASDDGTRVFFESNEKLSNDDNTDSATDVYQRLGGNTTLISAGVINGDGAIPAFYVGNSTDGAHVYFISTEQLVSGDMDAVQDLYERSGGTTLRVSAGQVNGNGAVAVAFDGASDDGTKIFFHSAEQLTSDDMNGSGNDVYMRSGGTTTRITVGPIGTGGGTFRDTSADGSRVIFETTGALVPADSGSGADIYVREGAATTTMVTSGNPGGGLEYHGSSADRTTVFYETTSQLLPADTDIAEDIYESVLNGGTALRTGGTANSNATYLGNSEDGSHLFFRTTEKMVSDDTDSSGDFYDGSGGVISRVSAGQINGNKPFSEPVFGGHSADGSKFFFDSDETLTTDGTDPAFVDVWERSGGTTKLVSAGAGTAPFNPGFVAASADGSRVFVGTNKSLLASDADAEVDFFERFSGTTAPSSVGQVNGNEPYTPQFGAISTDGSRLFFDTYERLLAADNDFQTDAYMRSGGATTLISAGSINGNGPFDAAFVGSSADGTRAFFRTDEQLAAGDSDSVVDVYERTGGSTTQVSAGAINGNGAIPAIYEGTSQDGTHVFFTSDEQLVSGDTDAARDIYERFGGVTSRVSAGQINGNGFFFPIFYRASTDGSRVIFGSTEQLATGDTDSSFDLYERAGGVTTRASAGQINGNGAQLVTFSGASADATHAFFTTNEQLVAADTDSVTDVYERFGGTTSLVSAGQINGNGAFTAMFGRTSEDGTRVLFSTTEPLVGADTDVFTDIYSRSGGTTTLVSVGQINGNGAFGAFVQGASSDATRTIFITTEQLVAGDTDASSDLYSHAAGVTTQISAGAINGNGNFAASFGGASADATHVFFDTFEQLVPGDTDALEDTYERFGDTTRLASTGKPAPPAPTLSLSPSGPANNNAPRVGGSAETSSTVRVFSGAGCSGSPVVTGTAAALASPGFALSVPDNATSSFSATATDANNSTSPCSAAASYREDSAAPARPRITSKPKARTRTRKRRVRVRFRFTAEAGATRQCKLDRGAFTSCRSPRFYRVKPGRHTFRVRARDAAGNTGAAAVARFRVIRRR